MYGWLWRTLPGGRASKAFLSRVLVLAVCALPLLLVVFPWAEPMLPFNDVTVDP